MLSNLAAAERPTVLLIARLRLDDWLALGLIESACGVFLILVLFQAPIGDYLMRRRMRKKAEYAWKLRQKYKRKYEKVAGSKWHGRNSQSETATRPAALVEQ